MNGLENLAKNYELLIIINKGTVSYRPCYEGIACIVLYGLYLITTSLLSHAFIYPPSKTNEECQEKKKKE